MNKYIVSILLLLLMVATVFAQPTNPASRESKEQNTVYNDYDDGDPLVGNDIDAHGCKPSTGYSWCESSQQCVRKWETPCADDDTEEDEVSEEKPTITGLENAILRVRKNETREHLQEVLLKIQTKRLERLNRLENATIETEDAKYLRATGKGPVKILGLLEYKYSYAYKINRETGQVTREKKWYDAFLSGIEN